MPTKKVAKISCSPLRVKMDCGNGTAGVGWSDQMDITIMVFANSMANGMQSLSLRMVTTSRPDFPRISKAHTSKLIIALEYGTMRSGKVGSKSLFMPTMWDMPRLPDSQTSNNSLFFHHFFLCIPLYFSFASHPDISFWPCGWSMINMNIMDLKDTA